MKKLKFMVVSFLFWITMSVAQTATNLTDAELEPVAKHAIKGKRLQEDIQKLQTIINAMPEVKRVQEDQKKLQDEETILSKTILKAHKLDDGKHVVDFNQGRIVEQQQAPDPATAKPAKQGNHDDRH